MAASQRHHQASDRRADVLDKVGHACERARTQRATVILRRAISGSLIVLQDDGVESRIGGFRAGDCCIDEFSRARRALAYEFGEADRVVVGVVGLHEASLVFTQRGPLGTGALSSPNTPRATRAPRGTSACDHARAPTPAGYTTRDPYS